MGSPDSPADRSPAQGYAPARPRRVLIAILAVFFVLQVGVLCSKEMNRPFTDEAHYVMAGTAILAGEPGIVSERMTWFQGSPFMYPPLSGLGFEIFGLVGLDFPNILLSLAILSLFCTVCRRIFGWAAALWSTGLLAANGLFIAFAHLGVYDALACAFMLSSLVLLLRHLDDSRTVWLILAGLLLSLATLTKYPYGVTFFLISALFAALWVDERGWPTVKDIAGLMWFPACFGLPTLAYFVYWFGAPLPQTFGHYKGIDKGLLFTGGVNLLYILVPLTGALLGWRSIPRHTLLKGVMLGSLFVWPLIHISNRSFYSSDKHALLGALFAYPLLGPWLDDLWRRRRWASIAAMLAFVLVHGLVSFGIRTLANVDLRGPIRHIAEYAQADDRVLVFCCHMAGRLVAKAEEREDLRIEERVQRKWGTRRICAHDWLIANESRFAGEGQIEQKVREAGCDCEASGTFVSKSIDYTGDSSVFGIFDERMTVFACSGRGKGSKAPAD
jgi:4-amino-4-deoxy-L-arabinose transferase-like glycosyltransferase